jgi:hypothetical protein
VNRFNLFTHFLFQGSIKPAIFANNKNKLHNEGFKDSDVVIINPNSMLFFLQSLLLLTNTVPYSTQKIDAQKRQRGCEEYGPKNGD